MLFKARVCPDNKHTPQQLQSHILSLCLRAQPDARWPAVHTHTHKTPHATRNHNTPTQLPTTRKRHANNTKHSRCAHGARTKFFGARAKSATRWQHNSCGKIVPKCVAHYTRLCGGFLCWARHCAMFCPCGISGSGAAENHFRKCIFQRAVRCSHTKIRTHSRGYTRMTRSHHHAHLYIILYMYILIVRVYHMYTIYV